MNEKTLELNTDSNIHTIINEYRILKEDTEKRVASIKKDVEVKKEDEIIKAKNKIYDYFEKIQDSLPDNFKLGVRVDSSISIEFEENCVVAHIGNNSLHRAYHLSRKNEKSKVGYTMLYDLFNPEYFINLVEFIKAWDKIKSEVETKILNSIENSINYKIRELSSHVNTLELLENFNS